MVARARGAQDRLSVCRASVAIALVAALSFILSHQAYAVTFPSLTGRVVDEAEILDKVTRDALEKKLADFESKTTGQLVVVTLKSLQGTSIEDYGYQLGRHWQIGQKEKNSGALLIVAPNERKVRVEVGYGLEGNLTDAVSKLIIENSILPRFKAGDYSGGVTRGVDDIIQVLTLDPEEWKQRAKQRPDHQSAVVDLIVLILFLLVFFMVVRAISRQSRAYPTGAGRREGSSGPILLPIPGSWDRGSSDSSWSGSSGGFSGGGGSFGGGGASGSW